jgi:glycosyltransferase involved in cell wall biosynthesis
VEFLGRLGPVGISAMCGRAEIYASPALYEPFGLAVLEAALSGCALVLSDIPTFRELWQGCAVFVAGNREEHWERAIDAVTRDHAGRKELQRRAVARALQFSPKLQAGRYEQVYRRLAKRSAESRLCAA